MHICDSYEKAKENFINAGGDIHDVYVVEDKIGNMYFTFDNIDFMMTEDGDIYEYKKKDEIYQALHEDDIKIELESIYSKCCKILEKANNDSNYDENEVIDELANFKQIYENSL